jgi:hypothetical protein
MVLPKMNKTYRDCCCLLLKGIMSVKGTFIYTLKTGENALILLAENKAEQEKLYHYLAVDAYRFKKEIVEEEPRIELISAGYRNEQGEILWSEEYIPVPKWYDLN